MRSRLGPAAFMGCLALGIAAADAATQRPPGDPSERAASSPVAASVVKVFVHSSPPDLSSPWQRAGAESSTGSGVVIAGNRILTAAHLVADAVSIQVKRPGQPERFAAKVEHVSHDADLAVIRPVDAAFFDGVSPIAIGRTPGVNDRVDVYGFPVGGDNLSVTSGVISRIEVNSYSQSLEELLLAQIDAAVNAGNSGGPVVADGRIVGIALETLDQAESIGFMAPSPVIEHFLADVEDGRYDGFPRLGIETQNLESPANRAALGLAPRDTGILVCRVDRGGAADGVILPGDVLTAIDDIPIANDESAPLRDVGRVHFAAIVRNKQIGEALSLTLRRNGDVVRRQIVLERHEPLVPGRHDDPVQYFVFAGIVFRPLSTDYLQQFEDPSANLVNYAIYHNVVPDERRQVLFVQKVLPHPVNQGYEDWEDLIVRSVNGIVPRDMNHLVAIIDGATARWLRVVTEDETVLTLDLEVARKAQPEILAAYGINKDRSLPGAGANAEPARLPDARGASEP